MIVADSGLPWLQGATGPSGHVCLISRPTPGLPLVVKALSASHSLYPPFFFFCTIYSDSSWLVVSKVWYHCATLLFTNFHCCESQNKHLFTLSYCCVEFISCLANGWERCYPHGRGAPSQGSAPWSSGGAPGFSQRVSRSLPPPPAQPDFTPGGGAGAQSQVGPLTGSHSFCGAASPLARRLPGLSPPSPLAFPQASPLHTASLLGGGGADSWLRHGRLKGAFPARTWICRIRGGARVAQQDSSPVASLLQAPGIRKR